MGFVESLQAIVSNPWFYVTLLGLAIFAYGTLRALTKVLPIKLTRTAVVMIAIVGVAITSGLFGANTFGTASLTPQSGVQIADLQVTTSFATDGDGNVSENTNVDDLVDIRLTDAQSNESSGIYDMDDGIITIFRSGELNAMSCPVIASTPAYASEVTPGDGSSYKIVEETSLGELEVYLNAKKSGSGAAAATTSPKEKTTLEFDEGISQAHLGVLIEVDETAHDNLNKYSYRDVVVNVCGKPMTFRVHRMD